MAMLRDSDQGVGRRNGSLRDLVPLEDRVRFGGAGSREGRGQDVRADLVTYYQTTGRRDLVEVEKRLAHLDPFFTGARIAGIGPARVTEYVAHRQGEGAANGTVNRETSVLGRMLRLAYKHGKLARLPLFDRLAEARACRARSP
jgi:hypothetical protein